MQFEIDSENPFFRRTAPDEEGGLRTVVVFRLFPVGDVLQTDHETSELPTPNPPASVTTVRAATAAAAAATGSSSAAQATSRQRDRTGAGGVLPG